MSNKSFWNKSWIIYNIYCEILLYIKISGYTIPYCKIKCILYLFMGNKYKGKKNSVYLKSKSFVSLLMSLILLLVCLYIYKKKTLGSDSFKILESDHCLNFR